MLVPPVFPRELRRTVLWIQSLVASCLTPPTGYHLLWPTFPGGSGSAGRHWRLSKLHIYHPFQDGIRFALCRFRSPLLTASLLISFPPGTKMFQFPPGFPPSLRSAKMAGSPIRRSPPDLRLPAPPRGGLSQLGTSFFGPPQAKPSPPKQLSRRTIHLAGPLVVSQVF